MLMAGFWQFLGHLAIWSLASSRGGKFSPPSTALPLFTGTCTASRSRRAAGFASTMTDVPSAAECQSPDLKVMALGASITAGQQSSTGAGYRQDLFDLLQDDGFAVSFIGTQKRGKSPLRHEGFPGKRIDQILHRYEQHAPELDAPDVVLINAGANDVSQKYKLGEAGHRMHGLMNKVWENSADATIILSSLLVHKDPVVREGIAELNDEYLELADSLIADGKKVVYVDMQGPGAPTLDDLADHVHPNDAGYAKMATLWHEGIVEAVGKGFLGAKPGPPTSASGHSNAEETNLCTPRRLRV